VLTYLHKPLYVQIQEYLAEKILNGEISPETRIPSERELSQELGVSRMTVRRAITELVNEGLIERRHGAGTFVAKPKATIDAFELISYYKVLVSRGFVVTRQLIEFSEIPASKRLADRLQVEIGHPLYHIIILYLANRVPAILKRTNISCERIPELHEYNLEKTSIYDILTDVFKMRIHSIDQSIEAVVASEPIAKQLRVDDGFPLLMINRVVFRSKDGLPIQYSQDFLRSDYARIHVNLELLDSASENYG